MQRLQDKAELASIGLEMGGCVVAGYLLGAWLEGHFGLGPWCTMLFLLFGFGAAIKGLVRVTRKAHASASSQAVTPSRSVVSRRFREAQRSW